jgi:taurine--2-oxoglutarate transaminase
MPAKKPTAQEVLAKNREYAFFSWSVQRDVTPIAIDTGKGVYFWDLNGKRYMDLSAQLVNLQLGYQHPKVVAAIQEQAAQLTCAHPSMATDKKGELARLLAEVTPGNLKKTLFTLAGADANENAIKFARMYTGRQKIITRYRSYHGATYGAITLTGDYRRLPVEPGIPGVVRVFDPYCYRCVFGQEPNTCHRECVSHIEEVIRFEGPNKVAALFFEGVTGTNGIIVPPPDYWPRIRALCDKYGILLVSDEVMSGFGRTGEWFSVDNWKVVPDIITMAKGLTCGYLPLGAVTVSEPIAQCFEDKYLYMGLTYAGHVMGCAAGVATINAYKEERIIEHARELGVYLGQALEGLKKEHVSIGDVRYIGLFTIIELVKDRVTREPMPTDVMNNIRTALVEKNLSTFVPGHLIFVTPPLIITRDELDTGLSIIDEALKIADAAV